MNRKPYMIDPSGNVLYGEDAHENVISMHTWIARKFFPKAEFPEVEALNAGWIFGGSHVVSGPYINADKEPTEGQWEALAELGVMGRLHIYDRYNFKKFTDQ